MTGYLLEQQEHLIKRETQEITMTASNAEAIFLESKLGDDRNHTYHGADLEGASGTT